MDLTEELLYVGFEGDGWTQGAPAAAGIGVPISLAWGGAFILDEDGDVDIEWSVPFIATDGATGANAWTKAHFLVDGVSRCELWQYCPVAFYDGGDKHRTFRVEGLDAGEHTIVVTLLNSSSTVKGHILGASTNRGYMSVKGRPAA